MNQRKPIIHGRDHAPGGADPILGLNVVTVNAVVDGLGAAITNGIKGDIYVDDDFEIEAWTLLADTSGDVVVDVWKDVLANYPPDVADSITGSSPPTLLGQDHARDTTLDGWTTEIDAGDSLRYSVSGASAISRLTLALTLRPR